MRKIFVLFSAVGIAAMGASFAACSSSSGDDTTTPTDSGPQDTSIPTDTGTPDSGPPVDSGPCATCGEIVQGTGAIANACTGSVNLALAVLACACNTTPTGAGEGLCDTKLDGGADAATGACSDLCASPTSGITPSGACLSCAADNCTDELGACNADGTGVTFDAGPDGG